MSELDANAVIKVENEEENKTPDKKQIEAEEKEVMLRTNVDVIEEGPEKKDGDGPVTAALSGPVTEEGREVKPKFIPIGAIKMPGFFTRNSDKDKTKDDIASDNEDKEKSEGTKPKRHRLQFLHACPFTQFMHHPRNEDTNNAENPSGSRKMFVPLLNVPLSNILRKNKNKDPEATLASTETLEDKPETNNEAMEDVKLETEEGDGKVATDLPLKERIRQRKFNTRTIPGYDLKPDYRQQKKDDMIVIGLVILTLVLVIFCVFLISLVGPPAMRPLRAGRYMTTLTTCGPVEGVLNDGVFNFYGIPYAVPPIAERRFTDAQPLNNLSHCWNDTLQVHKPTPVCLQFLENGTIVGEEDCLTVDIVTPKVIYDSPLPVVVLIGANTLAGGISPLQPSPMYSRTKEVVFVKPNFRLGALGFLALDILSNDRYPPTSGNYALSDLLAALQWIKYNIKYFGGDPYSVTLFGHRAGATLTAALTTIKKAQKLYSNVWMSSPSVIYPGKPLDQAQKDNDVYKDTSKCNDVVCLRRITPLEVMTATPDVWLSDTVSSLPFVDEPSRSWLVLDGNLLRVHAYENWDERRKTTKDLKPFVFGTGQHSAHADVLQLRHVNWTAAHVENVINSSVIGQKNLTDTVFKHFNKTYKGLVELTSAVRTVCPLVSLARMRLSAPLYIVRGDGAGAGRGASGLADINADVRAILGTFDSDTPEQRRYMSAMQHLFYYFVWHGRLSGPDSGFIAVGQDALPHPGMPFCDILIKNDIVPRYAHVD